MDVHLDAFEGQENASASSKESSSTEAQQDAVMRTDLSEMTDVESMDRSFASSARVGRRNALPDIQSSAEVGGTSDLQLKLEALLVKEDVKEKNEETTQDQLKSPSNEEK